jgi:hypothetical protein
MQKTQSHVTKYPRFTSKWLKKKKNTPRCICYHITNKTNLVEIQEEIEIKREKSKETLVDVYQHHQS